MALLLAPPLTTDSKEREREARGPARGLSAVAKASLTRRRSFPSADPQRHRNGERSAALALLFQSQSALSPDSQTLCGLSSLRRASTGHFVAFAGDGLPGSAQFAASGSTPIEMYQNHAPLIPVKGIPELGLAEHRAMSPRGFLRDGSKILH